MEELRVSIIADASGLAPGLAAAQSQVEAAATSMAEAQAIATAATKNLAEAQAQLGTAAAAGNAQAKSILAGYTAELANAKAQLSQVTAAEAEQVATTETLTGATAEATVATEAFAAAQGTAAVATGAGISARQAATASIGLLEGRLMSSNRAAGAFLATTLGLGPALQAAFPVIGALAVAGVLVDMGEKAYQLYEKFIDISAVDDKLLADFQKMQDSDLFNVHSIETATERLDDATKAATNLRDVAVELHEASLKDIFGDLVSGNVGTLATDLGGLLGARKAAEGGGKQTEDAVKLGVIQLKQEHEITLAKIETAHATDALLPKEAAITAEHAKRLAILAENQQFERKSEQALGNKSPADAGAAKAAEEKSQADAQAAVARQQDQLPLLQEIARARIEAAHAGDSELPPAERITAELAKQLELDSQKAESSREGTSAERSTLAALEDQTAIGKAQASARALASDQISAAFTEQIDTQDRAAKLEEENEKRAAEVYRQKRDIQVQGARDAADATIQAATRDFAATQQEIKLQEELGRITHRVAAQRLIDASRKEEGSISGALGKEQAIFDPALGGKEAQEYQTLQNKITAEAQKGALERERIAQQETLKITQQYKKIATEFNTDFTRGFNEWITKSQTAGQAFGHVLGQMELQVADFVVKWILQKTEMWAMDKVLNAAGLATQRATQAAANTAMITGDAGVAAAGTLAYYSAINPPIAPAMAAIAFSETLAYASAGVFDTGGMLPHMGMAYNKSGSVERILSPSQTSNFESLVNNGGSRSASLHQENHFGGGVTEEMLQAHTAQTMQSLRAMLRPEAFS